MPLGFPVLLFLSVVSILAGQSPYISAGMTLQYGDGSLPGGQIGQELSVPYVYREHFLDLTAGMGPYSLWSNLEFSSPPQIGPGHQGLRKLRFTWEGERFSLKLGDQFGQLGRGLALNFWENQGIDWDSSLRGAWLEANPWDNWTVDLVRGTVRGGRHLLPGPGVDSRIRDFSDYAVVTAVSLKGRDLIKGVSAGTYLVDVAAENPWFTLVRNLTTGDYGAADSTTIKTHSLIPGLLLNHLGSDHDFYMEIIGRVHRIRDADSLFSARHGWLTYDPEHIGWGAYTSLSVFPGRWGMTLEYKNYFLDKSNPIERQTLPLRLSRMSLVQNPPTVFREHSTTLLSRTPHLMDFEDEMGVQLEINVELNTEVSLVFNYSQSSRHTGFVKRIKEDFSTQWENKETSSPFWMSSQERFFPFQEFYGELNTYYRPLGLDFKAGLSRATDVLVFDESFTERAGRTDWLRTHSKISVSWEKRTLISVPTEAHFALSSGWGLSLYWEHQWEDLQLRNYLAFQDHSSGVTDSVITDRSISIPYTYRYVAMTVGKPFRFSIGWVYDSASRLKTGRQENEDPENDSWLEALLRKGGVDLTNKWFGLQGTVYLTPSTTLSLFYGSLQGGLKCDSGVCVYVPGIQDALTAKLTSNI